MTICAIGRGGARKLGEIKEVKNLSWQRDIGMVAEDALHHDAAPCFIFEDVPAPSRQPHREVNFFAGKRKNMTPGFSTDLSKIELTESFRTKHAAMLKRIRPNTTTPAR